MDSSDENISFDKNGKCNHCYSYEYSNNISNSEIYAYKSILNKIKNIKGTYNCIIGISGGLDSTFLLIHAVEDLKLRPLALHVDNGWNSGLANQNIYNLCDKLKVDLYTEVLDWNEFREMQISILESGVPDLEYTY